MASLAEILELQSVLLVESTLPADVTIAEWRRRRTRRDARARLGLSKLASEHLAAPNRDLRHGGAYQR